MFYVNEKYEIVPVREMLHMQKFKGSALGYVFLELDSEEIIRVMNNRFSFDEVLLRQNMPHLIRADRQAVQRLITTMEMVTPSEYNLYHVPSGTWGTIIKVGTNATVWKRAGDEQVQVSANGGCRVGETCFDQILSDLRVRVEGCGDLLGEVGAPDKEPLEPDLAPAPRAPMSSATRTLLATAAILGSLGN